MKFPDIFKQRYEKIAKNPEDFFSFLQKQLPRSFRINNLKADKKIVLENFKEYGIEFEQYPWYSDAFKTNDKKIGNTIEHFNGWIYIQEATSMLPPLVLKDFLSEYSFVLDAAAAPGSKTTQLADLMNNKGLLIANEISYMRTKALKFNLEKMGVLNAVLTNYNFKGFPETIKFDLILVDAPCSSEGTLRKDPNIISTWSVKRINDFSKLQKKMVLKAFDLLNPGGCLVYSTCTFAPEENEEVVDFLLQNTEAKIEKVSLENFKLSSGIEEFQGKKFNADVKNACRIWPQDNDTDGFFLAKMRKEYV